MGTSLGWKYVSTSLFVYKIIDKDEWALAKDKGVYLGSKKDLEDGYIHFSEEFQITGTLEKFFKGQENLLLLKVNTDKLEHLLWEQASDGNMFPHLYSPLEINNMIEEFEIKKDDQENFILPENY